MQPLDNPVWHALTGPHATVAEGGDRARRYRPEFSVWSAVRDDKDPGAWAELHEVLGDGGHALFAVAPRHPTDWETVRIFPVLQMVLDDPVDGSTIERVVAGVPVEPLTRTDVDAMAALARATEPGPWCERTAELGDFFGVHEGGPLAAMAGERLHLPTAVEISGVCTDPRFRGRGYAAALVLASARNIQARGSLVFLHVMETNHDAIRLYERLGFRTRVGRTAAVVRAPGR